MKSLIALIWCGVLTLATLVIGYFSFRSEENRYDDRNKVVGTVKGVIQFPSKVVNRIRATARNAIHTENPATGMAS